MNSYGCKFDHFGNLKMSSTNFMKATYVFGISKNLKNELEWNCLQKNPSWCKGWNVPMPTHFSWTWIITRLAFMQLFPVISKPPKHEFSKSSSRNCWFFILVLFAIALLMGPSDESSSESVWSLSESNSVLLKRTLIVFVFDEVSKGNSELC